VLNVGAIRDFGAVDILVNNAGIQHVAPIEEFPAEKWHAIIAVNLVAAFHTIRRALPAMKERRCGRIINIASAHAVVASPFKSTYVAAKHGIAGLTKTVALEAAESGVTVNAVCPGYVLRRSSSGRYPTPPRREPSARSRSSATCSSRRSRRSASSAWVRSLRSVSVSRSKRRRRSRAQRAPTTPEAGRLARSVGK
jgi:NAD(P)-dependent dehydrogenase (short-subunit alcohol dehydrogenase family)